MAWLDYRTAGESHGRALIVLIEGMPAGVTVDADFINAELARRQGGYGRSERMLIEKDAVTILSGVRRGLTIGSPIAMQIANQDWRIDEAGPVHRPRPGHADLAGSLKWLTTDCRETLERASARETAARVAAGAFARCLLHEFGIEVVGYVVRIHDAVANIPPELTLPELRTQRGANEVFCPDAVAARAMIAAIEQAKTDKETVGGIIEVQVCGHPAGLGSCMRWQDKLDGRLMQAVGSIQAIKGVEIGLGFATAHRPGSDVQDVIDFDPALRESPTLGFVRASNHAGGLEGGMTSGTPIVLRAAMKPISTLPGGLASINLVSRQQECSDYERSDVCAVPAASVVAENIIAFEITRAFLEKFGGDTLGEIRTAYKSYLDAARSLGKGSMEER